MPLRTRQAASGLSPGAWATAIALPLALVVGVLVFWLLRPGNGAAEPRARAAAGAITVAMEPSDPESWCARTIPKLPRRLAGLDRRAVESAGAVAAWGDPALVLRCGVPTPAALKPDAQLFTINRVAWVAAEKQDGTTIWTTTSLPAHVELTVPQQHSADAAARILNPLAAPLLAA